MITPSIHQWCFQKWYFHILHCNAYQFLHEFKMAIKSNSLGFASWGLKIQCLNTMKRKGVRFNGPLDDISPIILSTSKRKTELRLLRPSLHIWSIYQRDSSSRWVSLQNLIAPKCWARPMLYVELSATRFNKRPAV